MFNITSSMLLVLVEMQHHPAWVTFLKEFSEVQSQHVAASLHFIPDPQDVNARDRENILRGIAICLDVLYNSFSDPVKLLEDIKIIEVDAQNKQPLNPF